MHKQTAIILGACWLAATALAGTEIPVIPQPQQVARMEGVFKLIFPRVFAIAEATWSPKEARNYDDFLRRVKTDEKRLEQLNVNFRSSTPGDGTESQSPAK